MSRFPRGFTAGAVNRVRSNRRGGPGGRRCVAIRAGRIDFR